MDAPDWLGVPGSARYLGAFTVPAGLNQSAGLTFSPSITDNALVIVPDGTGAIDANAAQLDVVNTDTGAVLARTYWLSLKLDRQGPMVVPVSLAIGANWTATVSVNGTNSVSTTYYCWCVPTFPVMSISRANQPIGVRIEALSPLSIANGLPVMARPFDGQFGGVGGAGGLTQVTFPATAGKSWLITALSLTASTSGAGGSVNFGWSGVFNMGVCSLPAVAGASWSKDFVGLGLIGGLGAAALIGFNNAVAGMSQGVFAGGYLV